VLALIFTARRPQGIGAPPADRGGEPLRGADFESGAAPGWIGKIVMEGLPAGSSPGFAQSSGKRGPGFFANPNSADWDRGLFVLTPVSTLHVTYRHGTPDGWLNVFMHTDGGRDGGNRC
jgi:hypothetical protein